MSRKIERSNNDLGQYIEKITDNMIDEISQLRDDLLNRLEYLGLTEKERNFLNLMEKKDY